MSAYARLLTTEIDGQVVVAKRAIHPDHRDLLHRELQRVRAAEHPQVVRVTAATATPGGGFATAWAGGRTLATARLDPAAAARTMASVAATVADLHDRGVSHGRLAPSHVIIDPDARPVLCGFGPDPSGLLAPGTPAWRAACAADVEALGRLLLRLTGDQAELEPFPVHRFAREPRWDGVIRRSLQTLADQACDPLVDRRPSARALSLSLASLSDGDGDGARGPGAGLAGRVAVRLGASAGLAAALGAVSSQRAWSQGIRPLTGHRGGDPASAIMAILQLGAALLVLALVLSMLAEAAGRILDRPGLAALAERATPRRLRSVSTRLAGLAVGASVSLACQIRAPHHPPAPVAESRVDPADPPPDHPDQGSVDRQTDRTEDAAPPAHARRAPDRVRRTVDARRPPAGSDLLQATAITEAASIEAPVETWTVGPGDHLWAIADARVSRAAGRPAAAAEVARYWQRLIVENPDVTDPDLVLPGQVIALPAV